MVGATLAGVAMLAVAVVRVDDRPTGRIAATGLVVCGTTSIVVALAYGVGELRWSALSTWVYLVVSAALTTAAVAAITRAASRAVR